MNERNRVWSIILGALLSLLLSWSDVAQAETGEEAEQSAPNTETLVGRSAGLNLDAGLHRMWAATPDVTGFAGLQASFGGTMSDTERQSNQDASDSTWRNFSVGGGPLVGAEYRPIDAFSFGVQMGVNYTQFWSRVDGSIASDSEGGSVTAQGGFYVRALLW